MWQASTSAYTTGRTHRLLVSFHALGLFFLTTGPQGDDGSNEWEQAGIASRSGDQKGETNDMSLCIHVTIDTLLQGDRQWRGEEEEDERIGERGKKEHKI